VAVSPPMRRTASVIGDVGTATSSDWRPIVSILKLKLK
jgi:hypothetical protein